jgi:hypothetical protein
MKRADELAALGINWNNFRVSEVLSRTSVVIG